MSAKNRILILIPYFGQWPEWIDLYVYSCAQNKDIDWVFISDCRYEAKDHSNIRFIHTSFRQYCRDVSEILNIDFNPVSAYKLCDLRPFFPIIHSELIKGYEFWGYGDVDVIWGRINRFYTNELLDRFDVFSTHADRLSGHLAILRNTDKYTHLCFRIRDWKQKLMSDENHAMDELDFSRMIYPESKYIIKFYLKVVRKLLNWKNAWVLYYHIMPLLNSLLRLRQRRLFFKEQHTTPILSDDGLTFHYDSALWRYTGDKVLNEKTGKEHIYIHFMIYKKNNFRKDWFWKEAYYHLDMNYDYSNGVLLNKEGFSPLNQY
jgi:hypothetical protein